jgi:hypothetical protein
MKKETLAYSKPKLVYIAHKMGDDIPGNTREVLEICSEVLSPESYPFAPYLVAFQYLDDSKPDQRQMGMDMNTYFFENGIIDEVLLCGPYISGGMVAEIRLAVANGISVKCHNNELQANLNTLLEQISRGE